MSIGGNVALYPFISMLGLFEDDEILRHDSDPEVR
jgi:hypothetical protein